jgi:hypothetical protein
VSLLVYTAIITPVEVAFLPTKLDALFFVNRIVDAAFLLVCKGTAPLVGYIAACDCRPSRGAPACVRSPARTSC